MNSKLITMSELLLSIKFDKAPKTIIFDEITYQWTGDDYVNISGFNLLTMLGEKYNLKNLIEQNYKVVGYVNE